MTPGRTPPGHDLFTDRTRKVLALAQEEALRLNHEYVGTEHLLLGLLAVGSGSAVTVLLSVDIDLQRVREELERIIQPGPDIVIGCGPGWPHTPRAKKAIEYAVEEAVNFKHAYVGTEHLLLGLLREEEGVAAQILLNLGARLPLLREEVLHQFGPAAAPPFPRPLPHEDNPELPQAVQDVLGELDGHIAQLDGQKVSAVAGHEFERAAQLRDQANRIIRQQRALLRDWQARYTVEPAWLFANNCAVLNVALTIAEERRWGELPILADALEDAGCAHEEMLKHCRAGQDHAGRCWVVSLLLTAVSPTVQ